MSGLIDYARSFFAPRPRETVTAWTERELVIPTGPHAGQPFRVRNSPYLEFILNAAKDPKVRSIALQFASQLGKTTLLLLVLAYLVRHEPSAALFVTATATDGKSISKNQWQPLIGESGELSELVPTEKTDERVQNLEQSFINSALCYWVGANSSNALSGKAVRYLLLDEIRAYPEEISDESGALELALNRVKSFRNHKIFLSSTPTLPDRGINKHYLEGTQHVYEVPCPHCDTPQELAFARLKWGGKEDGLWDYSKVQKTAHFQCVSCGERIVEGQKSKMLRAGQWRQTNFAALPENLSFQLSSFYSFNLSWGEIAVKFLKSKNSINGVRDFRQNYEGLPWREAAINPVENVSQFSILERPYARGENPLKDGGRVLMACDVQKSTIKWVCRVFGQGESYLLDYGVAVDWDQIREVEARYGAQFVAIDSGYAVRVTEVYEEVLNSHSKWIAVKGNSQQSEGYRRSNIDPYEGTSKQGRHRIPLLLVNDALWKSELLKKYAGKSNWFIFPDTGAKYLRELMAEVRVEKLNKRTGNIDVDFRKLDTNDWLDCEKYLLALEDLTRAAVTTGARRVRGDADLGGEAI